MLYQTCKDCGQSLPMTRDYFGQTPSGGFRRKCRACMRAHVKAYDSANPEGAAARARLRREREDAAGGSGYTDRDLQKLRFRLGDRCAYCDTPLGGRGHLDHMTPVAKGGRDDIDNVTYCCESCNQAKHAKTVEEYFAWRRARKLPLRAGL